MLKKILCTMTACIWIDLLSSFVLCPVFAAAGEFVPDENTLFLAHYNTSLDADYSQGPPRHDAMDTVWLTKKSGWFGGGLVCRVGAEALKEAGADITASGLMPERSFDGIRYASPGNLDLMKGTFECRIKPYFSIQRAKDMPESWPMQYYLFTYTETNGRYLILGINSGGVNVSGFFYGICTSDANIIVNSGIDWKPGTWHHVAITWDTTEGPGTMSLFLDGRKAGNSSLAPLKGRFLKQDTPYFCIGSPAWRRAGNPYQFNKTDAVVDEVRISNIVRYRKDFVPPDKGDI